MKKVYITAANCISPLGLDCVSNWNAIQASLSSLRLHPKIGHIKNCYASCFEEEVINAQFVSKFGNVFYSKVEKMLFLALAPLLDAFTIGKETALIISTTKGNVGNLSKQQSPDVALTDIGYKIARYFGFQQKPIILSNACVSGVMAVTTAKRLIQMNFCTDAIVLAADEVSEFIVSGFTSFQALSSNPCQPYDQQRCGLNLGEAAAALLVTGNPHTVSKPLFSILGEASINDANHISGPSRTGEGLKRSVEKALLEAKLSPKDIDFISAHGTATLYNDEMEAIAFNRMAMQHIPLNSLKGYFGHTLGTSGLLEIVMSMESLSHNELICSKGFDTLGVSEPINIIKEKQAKPLKRFLKTASGFAGTNAAIIIEKEHSC